MMMVIFVGNKNINIRGRETHNEKVLVKAMIRGILQARIALAFY